MSAQENASTAINASKVQDVLVKRDLENVTVEEKYGSKIRVADFKNAMLGKVGTVNELGILGTNFEVVKEFVEIYNKIIEDRSLLEAIEVNGISGNGIDVLKIKDIFVKPISFKPYNPLDGKELSKAYKLLEEKHEPFKGLLKRFFTNPFIGIKTYDIKNSFKPFSFYKPIDYTKAIQTGGKWKSVDNNKKTNLYFEEFMPYEAKDATSEQVNKYLEKCADIQKFYVIKHTEYLKLFYFLKELIGVNYDLTQSILALTKLNVYDESGEIDTDLNLKIKPIITKIDILLKNQAAIDEKVQKGVPKLEEKYLKKAEKEQAKADKKAAKKAAKAERKAAKAERKAAKKAAKAEAGDGAAAQAQSEVGDGAAEAEARAAAYMNVPAASTGDEAAAYLNVSGPAEVPRAPDGTYADLEGRAAEAEAEADAAEPGPETDAGEGEYLNVVSDPEDGSPSEQVEKMKEEIMEELKKDDIIKEENDTSNIEQVILRELIAGKSKENAKEVAAAEARLALGNIEDRDGDEDEEGPAAEDASAGYMNVEPTVAAEGREGEGEEEDEAEDAGYVDIAGGPEEEAEAEGPPGQGGGARKRSKKLRQNRKTLRGGDNKWTSTNQKNTGSLYFKHGTKKIKDSNIIQSILNRCSNLELLYLVKHYEVLEIMKPIIYFLDTLTKNYVLLLYIITLYTNKPGLLMDKPQDFEIKYSKFITNLSKLVNKQTAITGLLSTDGLIGKKINPSQAGGAEDNIPLLTSNEAVAAAKAAKKAKSKDTKKAKKAAKTEEEVRAEVERAKNFEKNLVGKNPFYIELLKKMADDFYNKLSDEDPLKGYDKEFIKFALILRMKKLLRVVIDNEELALGQKKKKVNQLLDKYKDLIDKKKLDKVLKLDDFVDIDSPFSSNDVDSILNTDAKVGTKATYFKKLKESLKSHRLENNLSSLQASIDISQLQKGGGLFQKKAESWRNINLNQLRQQLKPETTVETPAESGDGAYNEVRTPAESGDGAYNEVRTSAGKDEAYNEVRTSAGKDETYNEVRTSGSAEYLNVAPAEPGDEAYNEVRTSGPAGYLNVAASQTPEDGEYMEVAGQAEDGGYVDIAGGTQEEAASTTGGARKRSRKRRQDKKAQTKRNRRNTRKRNLRNRKRNSSKTQKRK